MSVAAPEVARPRSGLDLTFAIGAGLWALALAVLFFYLLVYAGHIASLATYPYDLDQGEGYDVNSGWLIAQGRPIYTTSEEHPYYSSNYPPVFSWLLAPILLLTGPTLAAGRLLSAGAALLTAVLIGGLVTRRSGSGVAGLTSGLLFLASTYVFHTTPLARVNALALLFALAGLVCCYGRSTRWQVAAVLLFVVALFTKQTTVDAVAAGLLVLVLTDVRRGLLAGLAVGLIGGIAFLIIDRLHAGQFWVNVVVGNVNPFDWQQAFDYYRNFLEIHLVIVVLAAVEVARALRSRSVGPLEAYWIIALTLAISVGKWGAGESYFLAPIAASTALAGLTLARALAQASQQPSQAVIASVLLLAQGVLFSHGPMYHLGPIFADRGAQASVLGRSPDGPEIAEASPLTDTLSRAPGPVLVEDSSYALASGKEVVGNATHLRNLHRAGVWTGEKLIADLEQRRFSWVVLDAELYPEPVLTAIGRYYFLYEEYEINGTRQQLFAPGAQ
jgi:Dolichyl-phosphate-mannose-protein mannosyltransferase